MVKPLTRFSPEKAVNLRNKVVLEDHQVSFSRGLTKQTSTDIYFLHSSTLIGGGNKVILRLVDWLNRDRFHPVSIIPRPGPMSEEMEKREVRTIYIDFKGSASQFIPHLLTVFRLTLHLPKVGSAIVHVNDPYTYGLARRAWSSPLIRWVCHVHHPDITSETLQWSFRMPPELIITPSYFMAERVRDCVGQSIIRDRVRPIWNPIDSEWFSPCSDRKALMERIGCDPSLRHVIVVGAIAPHKGHEVFVGMAKSLCDAEEGVQFHVVGSSQTGSESYSAAIKALAGELGLRDKIKFWGFVPDEMLRDLMRVADVFVLPTRSEGFGLVLAESQACCVPVVTSDISPLDEIVLDGETGYLVARPEPEEYAACVKQLLHDEALRSRMGRSGRAWVESRFSSKAFCEKMCIEYERVLAGGRSMHGTPDSRPA